MAFVTLDISGHVVKTRVSTLTSVRGSFFDELFKETDGDFSGLLDKAGNLFVDRDFHTFSIVLGYLRDGASYPLPEDEYELKKLSHEASYLKLPELVSLVNSRLNPTESNDAVDVELNAYDFADCGCDKSCQRAAAKPPPRPTKPKPILKSRNEESARRRTTSVKPKGNVGFDGREGDDHAESGKSPLIDLPTPPKSPTKKHNALIPSCMRPQSVAISSPDNFTHVVHIGWQENVKRMIVDAHALSNADPTVKEILKAAEDPAKLQQPVYSMLTDGEDTVEVFFSGQTMKQRSPKQPRSVAKKPVSVTAI